MLSVSVIFFVLLFSSFQSVNSQEKTKEEREKELRMQEAIDEQKKAIADQHRIEVEIHKKIEGAQDEIERAVAEAESRTDGTRKNRDIRVYTDKGSRRFSFDEPFEYNFPKIEIFEHSFSGDGERTSWEFSKSIRETSFSRNYIIDVESSVENVVLSVNGDCKSGEISIRIIAPNGKTYSDLVIDEFGNLNWKKSFTMSETENKDKSGEWKFEIKSAKATGYFRISLKTF